MLYNAVIRKYGSTTLLGRVFVSNLEDLPSRLMVEYRGSIISRTTDLGTLFINNKEPLHLVESPVREDEGIVYVQIDCNKERKVVAIPVKDTTTVGMLREEIEKMEGIPVNDQRFEFCGERLEIGKTLKEYGVNSRHVIELRLALTGGGITSSFLTVDVAGNQVKGHCIPVLKTYQMYDMGMNIYGTCPEPNCCSKLSLTKEVVIGMKYGRLRLNAGQCQFPCSACGIGLITPTNFLVTRGRALFRYKKAGVREKVKTVLLESLGCWDEYKTFVDPTVSNKMAKYDFIEVTTVGVNSSPYHCVRCNFAIEENEVVLNCGHVMHSTCLEYNSVQKNRRECNVCNAKCYDQIPENDSGVNMGTDDYVDVVTLPTSAVQDEWKWEYEEMRHGESLRLKEKKGPWMRKGAPLTRSKVDEQN